MPKFLGRLRHWSLLFVPVTVIVAGLNTVLAATLEAKPISAQSFLDLIVAAGIGFLCAGVAALISKKDTAGNG